MSSTQTTTSTLFSWHKFIVYACFYTLVYHKHCCCLASSSSASTTTSQYHAYQYDMAPTFTPDGRLLQVEYASAATQHSSPILVLQLANQTLALVTLSNRPDRIQQRMLLGPSTSSSPTYAMAMSGVLADSWSLVQGALQNAAKHYQQFRTPWTVLQMTQALADACQHHAFGGGIRPFGSTILLAGFAPTTGTPVVYQTDPSGGILPIPVPSISSSSSSSSSSQLIWMVGGTSSQQRQIRQRCESKLASRSASTQQQPLMETLTSIAQVLVQIQKPNKPDAGNRKQSQEQSYVLEIVLLHPELGCHRLSHSQLEAIQQQL